MRARSDYDVIIVGAGCAGLSAAWHMLDAGLQDRRVLLVDPREEFRNDRTWCSWDVEDHPLRHLVEHTWNEWEVLESGGEYVRTGSTEHPYGMISAERFYDATLARVFDEGYEMALGEAVTGLAGKGDVVEVATESRTLRAPLVLDTRWVQGSTPASIPQPRLVQHFVGHVLEADGPAFTPGIATLMDFVPVAHGVHFFYVLPFDERRALVESTGMSAEAISPAEHEALLSGYIASRWPGRRFEVLHRESGSIPMDLSTRSVQLDPRIVPLGLRGGAARASTGYAFLGIQRQSAQVARAIAEGQSHVTLDAPHGARSTMLDAVFLSLMRRKPALVPELLTRLFRDSEPERLVRFLSGCSSVTDDIHVITRMKATPMLREASLMVAGA